MATQEVRLLRQMWTGGAGLLEACFSVAITAVGNLRASLFFLYGCLGTAPALLSFLRDSGWWLLLWQPLLPDSP